VRILSVSRKIANYIKLNNISISQISKDTGIDEEKLLGNLQPFSAGEFLELCFYLNIRPEDFKD
jgi:hypothetical protein